MIRRAVVTMALVSALAAGSAEAAPCAKGTTERIRYDWQLGGVLSWIASLAFPTHGIAELETAGEGARLESVLRVRDDQKSGYFLYRSVIDRDAERTAVSESGHSWDGRTKIETATLDYRRREARIEENDSRDGRSIRTKSIGDDDLRDVLTSIWMLRARASTLTSTLRLEIFSDGSVYPVNVVPLGLKTIDLAGSKRKVRGFRIVAAPEQQRKWPGGVSIWFSEDADRYPLRIDIKRSVATLQLVLKEPPQCAAGGIRSGN